MAFDPSKHLTDLKGKKYLEAKWRLVWFREDHPKGVVNTEMISTDPLIFRATVLTAEGEQLASGHGSATVKPGSVWSGREVEKAETAAISRALGHAGYGTQFGEDDDKDYLSDSPVKPRNQRPTPPQQNKPPTNVTPLQQPPPSPASTGATVAANGASADNVKRVNGESEAALDAAFGARTERATPGALYTSVAAYFNVRKHFDNWWEKHQAELDNLTLSEAVTFTELARWNQLPARVNDLKALASNLFSMSGREVNEALSVANGKTIVKWSDWDAGDWYTAQGALLAYNAGYDEKHVLDIGKRKAIADGVIAEAEDICARYNEQNEKKVV